MARSSPKQKHPHSPMAPRAAPGKPPPAPATRPPIRRGLWAAIGLALVLAVGIRLAETPTARRWRYERQPVEALRAAAERRPGDPVLRQVLGEKLLAAGRAGEAVEEWRRAATLEPDSATALAGLGRSLAAAGRDDEAFSALQLSLRKRPTAAALCGQGQLYLSHRVPEKAVPVLEQATRLSPGDPEAWRLLAQARAASGQWSAAEAAWRRLIALHPDDPRAPLGRAEALIQLGHPEEAEALLREALKRGPASAATQTLLGEALAARQPSASFAAPAEAAFREALRLDSTAADAAHGLALLLLRAGRAREAVPLLAELVRRHPEALRVRFQYARALAAAGRAAESDRVLADYHRRAELARQEMELRGRLTLRPHDPTLRARLSRLLAQTDEGRRKTGGDRPEGEKP